MLDNLRRRLQRWCSSETGELAGDTATNFFLVYDHANRCLGHLFLRGPMGVEALDRDDHSLGFFDDLESAAAAVTAEAAR
jgi:hypothetical protein